jgi:aldehyde:ferredoxin oxidoreductase
MGAKKLKAIAVCGTGGVKVNDPAKLLDLSLKWRTINEGSLSFSVANSGPAPIIKMFLNYFGQNGLTAFKNLTDPEGGKEMGQIAVEMFSRSKMRPHACFSCPAGCCYSIEIPDGPHKGYIATPSGGGESLEGAGGLMGVTEPGTLIWLTDQYDRMGWDTATPGLTIALAFELYERGIIGKEQTDGLELKWGNADAIYELMQKMIKGEGIGKILAKGPKATAEYFGGEALKYVAHVKGTGFNLHDFRPTWGQMLSYGVSGTTPCHQGDGPEMLAESDIGYNKPLPWTSAEDKADSVWRSSRRKLWYDSAGICMMAFFGTPDVSNLSAQALAATTGWHDFSKEEAWKTGERILHLLRVFSVRRGHLPRHDLDYGERLLDAPTSGMGKGKTFAPYLKDMVSEYYTVVGWEPDTGKPKKETLAKFGLEKYYQDIGDIEITEKVGDIYIPEKGSPSRGLKKQSVKR